ncbi:S8 family peptidase [Algoriphagus aquimarinus]|uniref:Thermitase n=1 Tax=Algoriphagus aquimarinus TaxID=237018 RepID=A0A1I1BQ81_9BACT|nr:S8 family serine peptidase [Algoriphagus aquimarinus]SFB50600.1 thermitase [Algoriphagus aquimarinus]
MKKIVVRFKEGEEPKNMGKFAPMDDIEVKFKPLYSIEPDVTKFIARKGLKAGDFKSHLALFNEELLPQKSEEEKKLFRTYTVEIENEEEAKQAISKLQSDPTIEYVQESKLNKLYYLQNDPLMKDLWGITKINCPKAWDSAQGENIVIAVLDTGVDYLHTDLSGNMWKDSAGNFGRDFSDNNYDPMDYHGHGTHVAGTIAAVGNNSIGVVGVAPKAKIMAVKIFPNATDDVCAEAIKYAVDNGAHVINNSWGPTGRNPVNKTLEDAIDYALSKGVVVVFAAGNEHDEVKYYSPANHMGVICVGASDIKDNRCGFSNYGPEVTVAAPGEEILSTQINGGYTKKRGTSMAAPHVSGLAALVISGRPTANANQIKGLIETNSDKIYPDKPIGLGRINAANSL